jgi:peptidoglycan hydrolase CwlO-like protein
MRPSIIGFGVTSEEDIATVARQLAELTQMVEVMAGEVKELLTRADDQRERTDTQQERIELAARELTDVSNRLQAAADALRQSI